MLLADLMKRISYQCIQGTIDREITSVVYDTRKQIQEGACYICVTGVVFDGHEYAGEAVKQGAVAIIAEHPVEVPDTVTVIIVENSRIALSYVSAAFFGYPAEKLKLIGITGTKGKTTTAYMIYTALMKAGIIAGLIGTIEVKIGDQTVPASHTTSTTPESFILQEYFARMVEAGVSHVVMEVSSQSLKTDRVAGIQFDIGVFTNLEPDHIAPGEHPDFADYMYSKSLLFQQCDIGIANWDDEHMEEVFQAASCRILTYGTGQDADLYAEQVNLHNENGTIGIEFETKGCMEFHVHVGIPGKFNLYNALAAILVCQVMEIPVPIIQKTLEEVRVRGRVEPVPVSDKFSVMLDYAHNAMSLRSLLTTLREYHPKRLVCMFGCGGNRSRDRRFDMGEISSRLADLTVVTSDNPRYEEPEDIINDILTGVKRAGGEYVSVVDRYDAIRYCIRNAREGDLIVIAGKGHEDYQEIQGVKYPMDDRKMIMEAANEINHGKRNL